MMIRLNSKTNIRVHNSNTKKNPITHTSRSTSHTSYSNSRNSNRYHAQHQYQRQQLVVHPQDNIYILHKINAQLNNNLQQSLVIQADRRNFEWDHTNVNMLDQQY